MQESRSRQITGSLTECSEELIERVVTAAIEVHRELGPGLLESVYECALGAVLLDWKIPVERQVPITAWFRDRELGVGFRADLIIDRQLLLEIKCVDELAPIHTAQMITYLKLMNYKRGFIFNFKKPLMKGGLERISI